ncbi:protein YhfH [Aeribacillus pallidus]|nr:YhfH family protein [Bacillus sp. (in: firmicutes)]
MVTKICVQCGEVIKEKMESHFIECERCLSKKED